MTIGLNKVTLMGNLGQDPEIRTMSNGKDVATLNLATGNSWKDRITGERKEKTEWHRVVVFTEHLVALIKNHVKKGSKLYVEGSLQTRKWADCHAVERFTTEIVLNGFGSQLILLNGVNASGALDLVKPELKEYESGKMDLDDEIPF